MRHDAATGTGQGAGDFDGWRAGHITYFNRHGGWSEEMRLLCERFRVVEVVE